MSEETETTPSEQKASQLFVAAIGLVFFCVVLVGIDYRETRTRAGNVPLNTQRLEAVERNIKEATAEQTQATRELAGAVVELREVIAEMRGARGK